MRDVSCTKIAARDCYMVKVYSSPISTSVHNLKNALEARGIECDIRGEALTVVAGEIPPVECWAELWILDDSKADEAKLIISGAGQPAGESWTCPSCSETVEAEFGQCWSCQAYRPS